MLWIAFVNGDVLKRKSFLHDLTPPFPNTDTSPAEAPFRAKVKQLSVEQWEHDPESVDVSTSLVPRPTPQQLPSWLQPRVQTANIIDGFIDAAQPLNEQERGVWAARIGFRCEPQTLQTSASQIDLTRERVRQIESKIYKKIRRHPFWAELADRLTSHIEGRKSPLLLNGISAIDPWFKGSEDMANALGEIFNHLLNDEFSIIYIGESPILTQITQENWNQVINSGKSMLRNMAQHKVTEEYAKLQSRSVAK